MKQQPADDSEQKRTGVISAILDGDDPLPPLVDFCIRFRWPLFLSGVIAFLIAWPASRSLEYDRRLESMFRPDDPRYQQYVEFKQIFGGLETCIIAYDDDDLFSSQGLRRLQQLREKLLAEPGVDSVLCLDNARRPGSPFDGRTLREQLEAGLLSPEALEHEILTSRLYRGRLVSADGRTAILWVSLAADEALARQRGNTIDQLRKICAGHSPQAVLAGGPVLVNEVFRHLERDGRTLGIASSVLLGLVITVLFRNWRWIVLPLLVVQFAIVWTKATLAWSGIQMSMVSSPLVALVTVIGVATIVHLTVRFRECRLSSDSRSSLKLAMLHVGPAVFWTCMTTVAGFAALLASHVAPVANFGLMMALGCVYVFVAAGLLSPVIVLSCKQFANLPGRLPIEDQVVAGLRGLVTRIEGYPYQIGGSLALLILVTAWGISRVQIATDFNENFRRSSEIVKSFNFLMERIDGINTIEMLLPVADKRGAPLDRSLTQVREMQEELERESLIASTMSVVDILDFVQIGLPDQRESQDPLAPPRLLRRFGRLIPPIDIPQRAKLAALDRLEPSFVAGYWNRDAGFMRVIVQARHVEGAAAKIRLIEKIEEVGQRHFPGAKTTGMYVLTIFLSESLMSDQWTTFTISLMAIATMLMISLQSWRLGLIALVPNVGPILMVMGAMGWFGFKINMATAMLASVSLGLSVDFSIHYLRRFQEERRAGRGLVDAMTTAHGSVGLAMVVANVALIVGFLALLLSSLIPTVHFGLLVSVAMLGGLIGNLVILPLLLRLFIK
ncbi:MAG TPA: MMPL family transporter [Pirellulaceae bacterium]|nr:MMPL family transporter [Pirellulaceae bacterium]HMO91074.1 MMPL family transporter [Pirellulaceae bacterium]HMP68188.1 MMPL family transporter [Pirellulaceae bacterium]